MSRENIEVVQRYWRDFKEKGIEAAAEHYADDCVLEDVPGLPDRGVYRGKEGVRERERHFKEMWEDWDWELVRFVGAGDDVVVAMVVMRAHGKGSGAPIELQGAFVYEVRDGRIVSDRAFTSRSQALEAAGLEE